MSEMKRDWGICIHGTKYQISSVTDLIHPHHLWERIQQPTPSGRRRNTLQSIFILAEIAAEHQVVASARFWIGRSYPTRSIYAASSFPF
jgi:hypothetical protein